MTTLRGARVLVVAAMAVLTAGSAAAPLRALPADAGRALELMAPPGFSARAAYPVDPPPVPLPGVAAATLDPVPPRPPRVGLQVGHWQEADLPDELARQRPNVGTSAGGHLEVEVNLAVARQVAERLEQLGIATELLPATIPPRYQGDAFVALHADGSLSAGPRGYKLARARRSALPATDDALLAALQDEYGAATGLPLDPAVTLNMTGYYAFNNERYEHAIAVETPAVILEMGYLTNTVDRELLIHGSDVVVEGIARGIERFLQERPPVAERERPRLTIPALRVSGDGVAVRGQPSHETAEVGRLEAGRTLTYPERVGDWFRINGRGWGGSGWVDAAEVESVEVPRPRR